MNKESKKEAAAVPVAPATKTISPSDAVANLKGYIGELVNNNLEMAIAVAHLVKLDLERIYADQLRYQEITVAQNAVKDAQDKAAKANGDATGKAPEGPNLVGIKDAIDEEMKKAKAS